MCIDISNALMAQAGKFVDPACPLEPGHPLNGDSLVSEWAVLPNSGWSGGNTLYDLVRGKSNPNDGTLNGGVTWQGLALPGGFGSLKCTGGSYLGLPFPAVASTTSLALVVTHYPITYTGGFTALFDDAGRNWSIFVDGNGEISFEGAMFPIGANNTDMTVGSWWQFVAVRDKNSGTTYYYVNGKLTTSGGASTAAPAALTEQFGANPSGGGSTYNGYYASVMLYTFGTSTITPGVSFWGSLYDQTLRGNPERWRWCSTTLYSFPALGIQFDTASNSSYQAATSSLSWSHTWSGSNRFLAVSVSMLSVTDTVTAMTYGGATCTFINAQNVVGGTGRVENWRICQNDSGAPAAGSNTIAVTISGSLACAGEAASYTGVHQTTPTEGAAGNSGINTGSPTNATVSVTTVADQDWVYAALATNQNSGIASSQNSRNVVAGTLGTGADADTGPISPAASQTMTFTGEGITSAWAVAGFAIRPVGASGAFVGDDDGLTYTTRYVW